MSTRMNVAAVAARALLALVLLAAWQTALLHPLQHLDEQGQFVHLGGAAKKDERKPNSHSDKLCDVLAALAVCAHDGARAVLPERAPRLLPSYELAAPPAARSFPPFHAQGPPLLPKLV